MMLEPYYQQDNITIYLGDCRDVLPTFPDKSFDLVVTSPPYDEMRKYGGYSWNFEATALELYRVLVDGGVLVWVVGDQTINGSETLTSAKQKIFFREGCGFNVHDTMIYKSRKPPLTHNRYEPEFEYMFVLSRGRPRVFNPIMEKTIFGGDTKRFDYGKPNAAKQEAGDAVRWRSETYVVKDKKIRGNIWEYGTGMNGTTGDAFAFEHPAMFPEDLARDHILSWTNPGDNILDCFNGSGTTTKKAKQLGRKAVGIEIEEKYCEIAVKRLAQMELFAPVSKGG